MNLKKGRLMTIIRIPDEILQRLVMYCQANDVAMAQIGSDEFGVQMILLGQRGMSPDQAAIIAAHMLLNGIVTGGFTEDNAKKKEEEKKHQLN